MARELSIPVTDGESVSAVHHEAAGTDWIVFCHGFLSDKTGSYEYRSRRAVSEGYDAVRFDFRGCGASDGTFAGATLSARIADLEAVLSHFDLDSVVLFGSSFGGTVAFHVAAGNDRVDALVARAPVTVDRGFGELRDALSDAETYTYETGQTIDARFLRDLDRYDFDDVAGTLSCPVAIFHGGRDESVDPADSFEAGARLDTDVTVTKFPTEGHRFTERAEDDLQDRLFGWLAAVR